MCCARTQLPFLFQLHGSKPLFQGKVDRYGVPETLSQEVMIRVNQRGSSNDLPTITSAPFYPTEHYVTATLYYPYHIRYL
jgi:hypothetical protein